MDTTRIAGSSPLLWTEIMMANNEAVRDALDSMLSDLQKFRAAMESGDRDTVLRILQEGVAARARVTERAPRKE